MLAMTHLRERNPIFADWVDDVLPKDVRGALLQHYVHYLKSVHRCFDVYFVTFGGKVIIQTLLLLL